MLINLTLEEAAESRKSMKNEKSSGPSGFPVEFYKIFWSHLKVLYIRSINWSFNEGNLSITQRQGVISLLPKKDKPRDNIKNWRPISLLNTSYKIMSGAIAKRIKYTLNDIISEDQIGFMKGRSISDSTRTMNYANKKHIKGVLRKIF